MRFPTTDDIISIFPPSSAIPSASGESNSLRWALRHSASILRGGFSLEPTIPRISIAFVAIVAITMMGIAIAPFPAPSDTARWARSVMDSKGRRITAEGTVNATTSRPYDAFISTSHGMHSLPFPTAFAMNAFMNASPIRIGFAQFV